MLAPIIGGAALLAAAGYNCMSPTSQLYGRTFTCNRGASRKLALTFDDGPNGKFTRELLEVLNRHGARATFFLIGRYVAQQPDVVREIVAAGHAIGNHTFTHPNLIFVSQGRLRREVEDCGKAIGEAVGKAPSLFRPPFGGRRPGSLPVVSSMGMAPIMWNVTGFDWNATSADQVERKVSSHIRGGDVILLHDGSHLRLGYDRSFTVTATERLITKYKEQGFEFVTVTELMKD